MTESASLPTIPAPPDGPPPLPFPLATSVLEGDHSTSTVLDVDPLAQIPLRIDDVELREGLVYAARELPGGQSLELKFDLLLPKTPVPPPLVVYVSGGGFVFSFKDAALDLRSFVAASGFAVASVEYRTLMHGASYVDTIEDLKAAVRHLRREAAGYEFDATKVAVWGESAGGYLAAMLGATNGRPEFDAGVSDGSSDVQAVVDNFGASDLSAVGADFDEVARESYESPQTHFAAYLGSPGRRLAEIPDVVQRANPAGYASASSPAHLLFHGTDDFLISPSQTLKLHNALLAAGASSTRYVIKGANHGDLAFLGRPELAAPWSTTTVMELITDFLHTQLDGSR